jgi:hypothetical protein
MDEIRRYAARNQSDLQVLGLFFARLLHADMHVMSVEPSPTLAAVMGLEAEGLFGTSKPVAHLLRELGETGIEPLSDGFGGSILRL